MKSYSSLAVFLACASFSIIACSKDASTANNAATKPDNTAVNKQDRDTAAKTPMDQSENATDIKITANIRSAVVGDSTLSTDAHNAKIITNNGAVTLRGVVDSAAEKDSVETKAKAVAGVASVDDQLEIKNP